MKNLKIIGFTVGITWLAFIFLATFIKGISVLFNPFFEANALMITIISGVLVLLLIISGAISLNSMRNRSLPS